MCKKYFVLKKFLYGVNKSFFFIYIFYIANIYKQLNRLVNTDFALYT